MIPINWRLLNVRLQLHIYTYIHTYIPTQYHYLGTYMHISALICPKPISWFTSLHLDTYQNLCHLIKWELYSSSQSLGSKILVIIFYISFSHTPHPIHKQILFTLPTKHQNSTTSYPLRYHPYLIVLSELMQLSPNWFTVSSLWLPLHYSLNTPFKT